MLEKREQKRRQTKTLLPSLARLTLLKLSQ